MSNLSVLVFARLKMFIIPLTKCSSSLSDVFLSAICTHKAVNTTSATVIGLAPVSACQYFLYSVTCFVRHFDISTFE